MSAKHAWRFARVGGFDQVRIETGADLMNLDQLDQKLWVALACPTTGLHFDAKTLTLIDTDKDGRIRAGELIAAVKWAAGLLKNPDDLCKGSAKLPLSAINDASAEGKAVLASAQRILGNLNRTDGVITEEDTDPAKIFAGTAFNGDGMITELSATDDETKAVMRDIMASHGSELDRSGKPGISQAKVDAFFAEAVAYSTWCEKAETDKTLLPLGDATAAAMAAVKAVKTKVDDFFARCRIIAFDPRAAGALNREEKEYLALTVKDLTATSAEIASLPMAHVEAGKALPLQGSVNPAWSDALARLHADAVKPLLGERTDLSEADWKALCGKLAAFDAWQAAKAGAVVEKLGLPRVHAILAGKAKNDLAALIAKDKAEEGTANAIASVDKLVRLYHNLHLLCTNFVNFSDFYNRGDPAIFQAGTLYLDQRSCQLTLPVEDAGRHATMAGLAGAYLAYCDCVRKGTGEKMQIVAAITDGDSDNLMVGRNGIFYDRKGRDWDATITKIVDNPISLRQAFWAPYKKFVRMIEEQVAKRAAAADAGATAKLETTASKVAQADKTVKPAEPSKKVDVGTVAALGVAFGAIGTFAAVLLGYVTGIIKLGPLAILAALVAVMLLISGPALVIAYLKLRKRNLGPILDANGWAVNAKAKINVPFGASLTGVATLPPGSQRELVDPYAEKKSAWPSVVVLVFVLYIIYAVLNSMGYISEWTHGRVGKPRAIAPAAPTEAVTTDKAVDKTPATP
ncbi:MAG: hypothetical protein A3K19_02060 [Lentisphaerae bacterium RIFOXYB12_FULL_65_16]|nr:MAG: hypothetical protein A3K18_25280 [Lentisphaerae bacterium RIFOXYA12_64_32]OGV92584.1 MAG: hypothetical protein A3K19_02060 [Lentisphaerae bacterium RIFOXYB12_FULL_65_16]